MTVLISSDKYPTMQLAGMVYMHLYNHLEQFKIANGATPLLVAAAKSACDKLNKYYPKADGLVYVIGTILDPRCKLSWYSCNGKHFPIDLRTKYRSAIRTCWNKYYKPKPDNETDAPVTKKSRDLVTQLFADQMSSNRVDKKDELETYLSTNAISAESDEIKNGPLMWWKEQAKLLPNLSKMAQDYLAVSGTGVPMERMFSNGPDLIAPKRKSMKGNTVRMCMCLRAWLKSKDQNMFRSYISTLLAEKMSGY